jgi:4-hydroxyphenylpyruvate dioxygenase
MRTGIATVSLSGLLADKLPAVAAAGFDGIEVFDNDLVASPLSPHEVAARCADLGLAIDLFQPVRDVEGVPPERFPEVLRRVRTKLRVMEELGTTTFLACSNATRDALPDRDLSAEQLHEIGCLAAEHGVTVAYEALAWGQQVSRLADAWDVVQRADHPAVSIAVDTFHLLARGDDGAALDGIPADRIGFLQVADAPLLDMNVLEWSRHHRCFPGQGMLDVEGVVGAALSAGYRGPVSLEVFSDVVRETDPRRTAQAAMRSLLFLEDRLARRLSGPATEEVTAAAPPPQRTDTAFLELSSPQNDDSVPALLTALGFARAGRHLSKPVEWWRNGDAHVVVNEMGTSSASSAALGVVCPAVSDVADRAKALLWPAVATTRGRDEAPLPGIGAPSGLHVFVSGEPAGTSYWQGDFTPIGNDDRGFLGIDHVGVALSRDDLDDEVGFFRTVFDLSPGTVEEFVEPHGRLRSRALRPARGDLRMVLNVEETAPGPSTRRGVTQVAFGSDDVRAAVSGLRSRGVALMAVPDNYYVDLEARFGLTPHQLNDLRAHHLLYDRIGGGELLHAYTDVLSTGFYVEVLERRGGYDGYGSASTHVRLAAQGKAGGR